MLKDALEKLDLGEESNADSICQNLVSDVISKKKTFLELVEDLEACLSSPDLKKHIAGLNILANILGLLPKDHLSVKESDLITQFFCGQVKQHHSFISEVLKATFTLVQNPHLSLDSLHNITTTLFSNVVWQTQTISDRKVFYQVLHFIIFNRIKDYYTTSSEFLFNIISSIDGERDPRNLLLLFSFLPTLYSSIPLGALVEDAFEVVACYFPVEFHSSSTDPGTITRDDLVSALTPCLLAVPEFTPLCIALIEEKLDSSLKSAKIDSYNLLVEGCKLWPPDQVSGHSEGLWRAMRQASLPPRDNHVADSAVLAMQALVRVLPPDSREALLSALLFSCEGFLSNVELTLFEPSTRLLLAAMQACDAACSFLCYKLLPGFVSLLQVTREPSKILVLNKLSYFIQICLQSKVDFDSGTDVWRSLYAELQACTQRASASPEVGEVAYAALKLAAGHIGAECRRNLYPCLLAHSLSLQSGSLRTACIKCIQAFALIHEDEVHSNIVVNLELREESDELSLTQNKFETVCSLAIVERFQSVMEKQFLCLISKGFNLSSVAISCLRNRLEDEEIKTNNQLIKFLYCQSSILPALCDLEVAGEDLASTAKIIQTLVRLQDADQQTELVGPLAKKLLQRLNSTRRIVLLESLLCPLRPEVTILSLEEVNQVIIPAALQTSDDILAQKSALQLLASLLNKAKDDTLLQSVSEQLKHCPPVRATTAHAYITKALVLRNHPLSVHWMNKLVDLLEGWETGEAAAEGVRLIVDEKDSCLSSRDHCLVRLLYRQRLFHLITPRLVSRTSTEHHLKAMAYLLQAVPYTVYTGYIREITPLLVRSLDTDCETLLVTVLRTVSSLLDTSHPSLQDHVDTFMPRFLRLAKHSPFMQVRMAALQCVLNSLKFPAPLILPHKQQVICDLVDCLDDKKRLVRKEAARARSKWFLLGAPTSDT